MTVFKELVRNRSVYIDGIHEILFYKYNMG